MASENLVLITGGSGFIGFRALQFALQAGWNVRAAVRSRAKADSIRNNPAIKVLKLSPSRLSYVQVPDLTIPGAYDQAINGVSHVIHVASAVPGSDFANAVTNEDALKDFIQPAIRGTINLLEAAKKEKSVKRIVITSSIVAIMHPAIYCGNPPPEGTVYSAQTRLPDLPQPPYPSRLYAYCVSKVHALAESEAWVAREKPHFTVVNFHPGLVFGRSELNSKPEDIHSCTNIIVMGVALGTKMDARITGSTVHIDDVARTHVEALDEVKIAVQSIKSFGLGVPAVFDDIAGIIAKDYAQFVSEGVLKDDGCLPTNAVSFDCSETENAFGFRFVPFEGQVRSVLDQYVELVRAA